MQFPWGPTQTWGGHLQEAPAQKAHSPSLEPSEAWLRPHCPAKGQVWLLALRPPPVAFTCVSLFPLQKAPPSEVRGPPLTSLPSAVTSLLPAMPLSLWCLCLSVAWPECGYREPCSCPAAGAGTASWAPGTPAEPSLSKPSTITAKALLRFRVFSLGESRERNSSRASLIPHFPGAQYWPAVLPQTGFLPSLVSAVALKSVGSFLWWPSTSERGHGGFCVLSLLEYHQQNQRS